MSPYFTNKTFAFLEDLAANNRRDWFQDNKARYEEHVKAPALQFIADFGAPLEKISPHFVADPRGNGGSLFRIHRDTRFSKDKSPYKTATGIQFRHELGKNAHAPGYYVHIAPGDCFVGIGSWRPESAALTRFREAIAEDPAGWRKAAYRKKFLDTFSLAGEALKRPPRGFDPEHPYVDDLRRKDFIAVAPLEQSDLTSKTLLRDTATRFRAATPFMRFLCGALDASF